MNTLGAASYTCNATICYGSAAAGTDAQFKAVQQKLNLFAGSAKFSPVRVDGFIGAGTVSALQAVLKWTQDTIQRRWASSPGDSASVAAQPRMVELAPFAVSKEMVAANAAAVADSLAAIASALQPSQSPPIVVTSPPPSYPTTPPSVPGGSTPGASLPGIPDVSTSAASSFSHPPTWAYYAAGGLAAVGVLFWLHAFAKASQRKHAQSASGPVSGGRRRRRRRRR